MAVTELSTAVAYDAAGMRNVFDVFSAGPTEGAAAPECWFNPRYMRGRPSPRPAMIPRWISLVPAAMVLPTLVM